MKKILVPCDFSKLSKEAFQVAIDIASRSKGEILLLHVLPVPTLYTTGIAGEVFSYDPAFFTSLEADATRELERIKATAPSNLTVSMTVTYGDVQFSVKKAIEEKDISLVIMGTSGSSGLTEILIGSNTEKVVRFSPVPVLAIRKAFDLKSIRDILLPSTLDLNQTNFIAKVNELQDFFGATLNILLINTPLHFRRDAEAKAALEEFAKHYKLKNYKLHFRNYAREDGGIVDFAYDEQMDIIAMGTHARKGLAHLFNGSVTEKVVNHIVSPVWTYNLKV